MRKIKVLHAAVSLSPSAGVIKQIESEGKAAKDVGIDWSILFVAGTKEKENKIIINLFKYIALRIRFFGRLTLKQRAYDVILLRYSVHDFFQLLYLGVFGFKTLLVHHTKEEKELKLRRGFWAILKYIELVVGRASLLLAKGHVAVTREIIDYELMRIHPFQSNKPTYHYPNGFNFCHAQTNDRRCAKIPELIYVASNFAPWHGLDLLLSSINKSTEKFILHLVGPKSNELINLTKHDIRVRLHGVLSADELEDLLGQIWCGLSSFALWRKGLNEASTLKVREYLAMGVPVYSGHYDAAFPREFPYYVQGPPDINLIIEYSKKIRSSARFDVIQCAKPLISKESILKTLYDQISERNSNQK
jgi:glycosyltransferase involved in cell wall biosynthesis